MHRECILPLQNIENDIAWWPSIMKTPDHAQLTFMLKHNLFMEESGDSRETGARWILKSCDNRAVHCVRKVQLQSFLTSL